MGNSFCRPLACCCDSNEIILLPASTPPADDTPYAFNNHGSQVRDGPYGWENSVTSNQIHNANLPPADVVTHQGQESQLQKTQSKITERIQRREIGMQDIYQQEIRRNDYSSISGVTNTQVGANHILPITQFVPASRHSTKVAITPITNPIQNLPKRRIERRETRTPEINQQTIQQENSSISGWNPKKHAAPKISVYEVPIQVQSRLDYLLKKRRPVIGQDVSSLAVSILHLYNDDIDQANQKRFILSKNDDRYIAVNNLFRKTTRKHFPVKIELIQNAFLKALFLLRKEEYKILHKLEDVNELQLFHGTKKENLFQIITNNFDWRLHGKARGNRFGMGVSFSPISSYSTNYCDSDEVKVMILALVLNFKQCYGSSGLVIPPHINGMFNVRYDSSVKPDRAVIVKYCDDEYYPEYIIHFKDIK